MIKLTYRDLQRLSSGKLLGLLGEAVGIVYVDGQPIFKIKVVSESDLTLDSQRSSLKNGEAHDSQATGTGQKDSKERPTMTVKPSKQELQAMIHKMEGVEHIETVAASVVPWYDPERHTSGDTVRMKVGSTAKVVTL